MLNYHLEIKYGSDVNERRHKMIESLTKETKSKGKNGKNYSDIEMCFEIVKEDPSLFPPFLEEEKNTEYVDMWKVAALRKKSLIYKSPGMLSIGILRVSNKQMRTSNTRCTCKLKVLNLTDTPLTLNYKIKFNSSLTLQGDRVGKQTISQRGSVWLTYEFSLESIPYKFPVLNFEIESLQQSAPGNFKIMLPIMPHWLFDLIHIPKQDFVEKYKSANGFFIQSDSYNLDQYLIKGYKELMYMIPELEKLDPAVSFTFISGITIS